VKLTSHLHIVPGSRMSGTVPPLPLCPHGVVLRKYQEPGTALPLFLSNLKFCLELTEVVDSYIGYTMQSLLWSVKL
jgi:hypothetical protein